jgi:hypothetical protein
MADPKKPQEDKPPKENPGHGNDPNWTPPGQGGTAPGQEKPATKPIEPEEPPTEATPKR